VTDRKSSLRFQPLTPERWADLEKLFGQRGACGGCWCMCWRLDRKSFDAGKGEANRRAFERVVKKNKVPPGVLAYSGDEPIGWVALAPRIEYVALQRSRVLSQVDEQPVWSVSCFFVQRRFRGRGVAVQLLEAGVALAADHGATIVEGYPVEPYTAQMPAAFAWTGLPEVFRRAGFEEVLRRSKTRPIMRRMLKAKTRTRSTKKAKSRP
jgi:GNAT superfamily N-acetyltransferase